ncbi:MAG: hypothetical protein KAI95_19340 [Bacteroidales bacterium]|nr:hypothetical protein [Bacteroidales bacterium]
MKNLISYLGLSALMAIVLTGCSKQHPITLEDSLELVVEEIFADDLYEDVFSESFDILFDPSDYYTFKSGIGDDEDEGHYCRTKTVEHPENTKYPKVVTIDFGDGCEDRHGHIRSGKMIITINGKYREEGSSRVITFDNYFVNGNQLMGTRTITNSGYNGDGHLVFTISLPDGIIIRADGLEIERIVNKTREWVEGEDTRTRKDDVFVINGIVIRTKKGVDITKTITDVRRPKSCRWPVSGQVEVSTSDDRPDAIIDFGEGKCDKWATITIEGETWRIDLKKRGKKWKKEHDKDDDGVEKEDEDEDKDDDKDHD